MKRTDTLRSDDIGWIRVFAFRPATTSGVQPHQYEILDRYSANEQSHKEDKEELVLILDSYTDQFSRIVPIKLK